MPQRVMATIIAVLGAILVVLFLFAGFDLVRAAGSGPRWRRRLVQGGLFVMASLGIAPGYAADPAPVASRAATVGDDLADSQAWKELSATWREAEEVVSGKRGAYPFDEAGKKRLLDKLTKADADVESFRKGGLLSDAEAGLLRGNIKVLVHGVQEKRPTEMRMATCYKPMMPTPVKDSLQRLTDRLPLLRVMVEQARVRPAVVERILPAIDADLNVLSKDENYRYLSDDSRRESKAKAQALRRELQPLIERIRELAGLQAQGGDLERNDAWQHLSTVWREAEEVRSGKRGAYPFDEAGKKRLLADLEKVSADMDSLRKGGLLTDAEASLLQKDLPLLRAGVEAKRTTAERMATCYEPMPGPSAEDSMQRLSDRLPLIRKMIDAGKLRPGVAQRILPTIEEDLGILADKRSYSYLAEASRKDLEAKANALRRELEPLVKDLKTAADAK